MARMTRQRHQRTDFAVMHNAPGWGLTRTSGASSQRPFRGDVIAAEAEPEASAKCSLSQIIIGAVAFITTDIDAIPIGASPTNKDAVPSTNIEAPNTGLAKMAQASTNIGTGHIPTAHSERFHQFPSQLTPLRSLAQPMPRR